MPGFNDLSKCLVALDQDSTAIIAIELSQSSWLVGGLVPGLEREPEKKLSPDPAALLALLQRWRAEAEKTGRRIDRLCVAYEAGRDGFWLARWLRSQGIECYVIHPTSVAVSREHRRAKTDRLDLGLLKRSFLGWLRGEPRHCSMAAIPTVEDEDAKRPHRERATLVAEQTRIVNRVKSSLARFGIRDFEPLRRKAEAALAQLETAEGVALPENTRAELERALRHLRFVGDQIAAIEAARLARLEREREATVPAMVWMLARIVGLGLETSDLLAGEVFSRNLRDRRAVARYAGLTGSPDESGAKRREKGLAKAGNGRVRWGMNQLAWRWLLHQKDSALTQWYRARTAGAGKDTRKKLIVALARKLLIALWRYVRTGEVPAGAVLREA